jgi:membrane protein implicated in regulation of membrane protease activity
MDWNASTWWWLGTAALVAAELATGTFYLLMLALGTAAAAVAAHAGLAFATQMVVGAVVGVGAASVWHWRRGNRLADVATDPTLNLDIGGTVQVSHWHPDGSTRVYYRGAGWDARYTGTGAPAPGEHVIRAVQGSRLMLDRAAH